MMIFDFFVFFQAEDGIRDLVRSRGLGDVYKRQLRGTGPPNVILYARRKRVWARRDGDRLPRHREPVLSLIHI